MLSYRLLKEGGDDDVIEGLNIYSRGRAAFDDDDVLVGLMVATHGALAAQSIVNARKVENLQKALLSNREIGTAMGVLMTRHHVTRDQAFDLLRIASQNSNRKLRDVAVDVAESGELPLPARRRRTAGPTATTTAARPDLVPGRAIPGSGTGRT